QHDPFLPLTLVEESSGVKNRHIPAGGVDRSLLKQADKEMLSARYETAKKLYRRCLNYASQDFPEPKFGLILSSLHTGDGNNALATLREHFPISRLNEEKGFEPDPNEWAWFIMVLLCCGKNREAVLRAEQFASVHNEELGRIRRVVCMLQDRN